MTQTQIQHKPIQIAFRSKGFDYEQIKRVGDVAMLRQTKDGISGTWYEVVIIRRHDGYEMQGRFIEPAEYLPSTSEWGRFGFTFRSKPNAERRFAELVAKAKSS